MQLIGVDGYGVARQVPERYGCGYEQIKHENGDAEEPPRPDGARVRVREKDLGHEKRGEEDGLHHVEARAVGVERGDGEDDVDGREAEEERIRAAPVAEGGPRRKREEEGHAGAEEFIEHQSRGREEEMPFQVRHSQQRLHARKPRNQVEAEEGESETCEREKQFPYIAGIYKIYNKAYGINAGCVFEQKPGAHDEGGEERSPAVYVEDYAQREEDGGRHVVLLAGGDVEVRPGIEGEYEQRRRRDAGREALPADSVLEAEEQGEGGEVKGLEAVDAEYLVEPVPCDRSDVGLYAGEDELNLTARLFEECFSVCEGEVYVVVDALAGVEDEGELEGEGEEEYVCREASSPGGVRRVVEFFHGVVCMDLCTILVGGADLRKGE